MATHTERTETVLSLYTGGGGLDIGFKMAVPTARTVCYIERELSSVAVLLQAIRNGYLDEAPVWSDSGTFDCKPWRQKVDWIIGGFPCQPFSVAGHQKRQEDERWVWEDIRTIICDLRPKFLFLENVTGVLVHEGIGRILGDLSEIGFSAEYTSLKASDVGAPHRRERVFILGYRTPIQDRQNLVRVANTNSFRRRGRPQGYGQRPNETETPRPRSSFNEKANGITSIAGDFPPGPSDRKGWEKLLRERPDLAPALEKSAFESPVRGGLNANASRLHRTNRLRVLGNGVVPSQGAVAFRILESRVWGINDEK